MLVADHGDHVISTKSEQISSSCNEPFVATDLEHHAIRLVYVHERNNLTGGQVNCQALVGCSLIAPPQGTKVLHREFIWRSFEQQETGILFSVHLASSLLGSTRTWETKWI